MVHGGPNTVHFGCKIVKNAREILEDAFSAYAVPSKEDWLEDPAGLSLFGVFDGHGGNEAAQHAAQRLHHHFHASLASTGSLSGSISSEPCSQPSSAKACADASLSELAQAWDNTDAVDSCSDCSIAVDLAAAEPPTPGSCWARSVRAMAPLNDRYSQNVKRALADAFIQTDDDLAGTEVGELVGTTAVVAVVGRSELFVAHCGDSRAVLCRKGVAIPLTSDHKPDRADELARVSSLGGKVVVKGGSHRVMGLLAMTRAIGDHLLRPYVIADPEVMSLQRTHEDELLLLATDGLWDVFSCQEATTLALRSTLRARERGASPSAACRVGASVLARGAMERGSKDNITVLVIDLRRTDHESAGSVAAVLASQCSDALPAMIGGGCTGGVGSAYPYRRKRSSSSGSGDDETVGSSTSGSRGGGGFAASAAVAGMSWSSSGGRHCLLPQHQLQQHQHQQRPRQSHMEALASTWAAAAAALSGRPMNSSRGSSGGGHGGSSSRSSAGGQEPRSSAPGGLPQSTSSSGQRQPLPLHVLQCMQSAPLCRGYSGIVNNSSNSSGASSRGASSSGGAPEKEQGLAVASVVDVSAAVPVAVPAAASPRISPSSMRSHSFSTYELNQRAHRASNPGTVTSSGSSSSSSSKRPQQQPAEVAIPSLEPAVVCAVGSAAAACEAGSGSHAVFGSNCCSADKPPLPPGVHAAHHHAAAQQQQPPPPPPPQQQQSATLY